MKTTFRAFGILVLLIFIFSLGPIGEAVAPSAPPTDPLPEAVGKNTKYIQLMFPDPVPAEPEKVSLGVFVVTAYCPCKICCDIWSNPENPTTASGAPAEEGITVGADWETIAAGSKLMIPGVGIRYVQDKPSDWVINKYDGRIIDLYFTTHADADAFGKKQLEIFMTE